METKLVFYFATMYAGKSGIAINEYDTKKKQNAKVIAFTTEEDNRVKKLDKNDTKSVITTRQNQKDGEVYSIEAYIIERVDFFKMAKKIKPDLIIVDEVQFIKNLNIIYKLARIVDELEIPVHCYGLKNDSDMRLFPASELLINITNEIIEIETSCSFSKRKNADLNLRTELKNTNETNEKKKIYIPIFGGEQKETEQGNIRYFQVSRSEYLKIKTRQEKYKDVKIINFKIHTIL